MSDKVGLVPETSSNGCYYFPVKKSKYFILLLLAFALLILYRPPKVLDDTDDLIPDFFHDNKTINILFWTRYFNHHNWYAEEDGNVGIKTLNAVNCPVTNCFFTHNRSHLSNISDFDAIMIHGPEYLHEIPPHYSPKQMYIFVALEAPTFVREDLNRFNNYYNMTMTYRMDSDVEWDYGKIVKSDTNEVISPSRNPNWMTPEDNFFDEEYLNIYQNKTRSIAWFVSNCNAFNKRQDLVKKMQELIDIDIYGKCGNLSCEGPECDRLLTTTYKFYLSFENSLCQEYVTEKFYRALNQMTVPLIFNGAKDKRMYSPPKSFIDVNEFNTVEDLVNYLKSLMNNPREYLRYFWWKKHYTIKTHPVFQYTHCELCKKLNNQTFMSEKHQYESIQSWYVDNMCNQTAHIKF